MILIKLADRLHNMKTLNFMPPEKRNRIAIETQEVYAPLANRFGMQRASKRTGRFSIQISGQRRVSGSQNRLNQKKNAKRISAKIIKPIEAEIAAHNIQASVYGRPKHLYSIYKK